MNAIEMVETGGVPKKGKSGELKSVLQYQHQTWVGYSKDVLGYVPPINRHNEHYVAAVKVQQWLNKGYTARHIARFWNAGPKNICTAGINKHGVPYDCPGYVAKVLAKL